MEYKRLCQPKKLQPTRRCARLGRRRGSLSVVRTGPRPEGSPTTSSELIPDASELGEPARGREAGVHGQPGSSAIRSARGLPRDAGSRARRPPAARTSLHARQQLKVAETRKRLARGPWWLASRCMCNCIANPACCPNATLTRCAAVATQRCRPRQARQGGSSARLDSGGVETQRQRRRELLASDIAPRRLEMQRAPCHQASYFRIAHRKASRVLYSCVGSSSA